MNTADQTCDAPDSPHGSLAVRLETVLFYVNLALTILGTIVIFRQQRVVGPLLEEFGVEIPVLTQVSLGPAVLALLPGVAIVSGGLHMMQMCPKRKLALQIVVSVAILAVIGTFLAAVLPVMTNLIDELAGEIFQFRWLSVSLFADTSSLS